MCRHIDFHTHILPGIDDGAPDLTTSEQMLEALAAQGVEKVVLTPHFYSATTPLNEFLQNREAAFSLLRQQRTGRKPDLILGAEVAFSPILMNYDSLSALTIGSGNYLLLELPFHTPITPHMVEQICQLISYANVTPILAHIERYPLLFKHTRTLDQLLDYGCQAQINLHAFSRFKTRQKAIQLLKSGRIFALGTDCHNMNSRPPDFAMGIEPLQKKLGTGFFHRFYRTLYSELGL